MDRQAQRQAPSPKGVLICKVLFGFFLCYHTMAITLILLPRESALYHQIKPYTQPYVTMTGNRQYWSMFTTKPYKATHDLELDIIDVEGNKLKTGELLPNLAPYDQAYFRYQTIFNRMQNKNYRRYFHAYVQNVKQKLEEARGVKIKLIEVRYVYDVIQDLKTIRETGQIGKPENKTKGSYKWD